MKQKDTEVLTRKQVREFRDSVERLHKRDAKLNLESGLSFIIYVARILLIVFALRYFVCGPTIVEGESMQTTLMDGERLFVEKVSYWFSEPKRGDIVIVHFPNRSENFVKRVIATAGETIEIVGGYVYINGERIDESEYAGDWYGNIRILVNSPLSKDGVLTVPEGHIFVVGDNRNYSKDSRDRDVGAIPLSDVVGKALCVYWPLSAVRGVDH